MKAILRVIAVFIGMAVLLTLLQVANFSIHGEIGILAQSVIGVATLAGWSVILVLGPIAAVQLWRFRRSGLYLSALLSALAFFYYVAGLMLSRPNAAALRSILIALIGNATLVALTLSSSARKTCMDTKR